MTNGEKQDAAKDIHATIEIYAKGVISTMDMVADHYGVSRAEMLDLLIATMQAEG